MKKKRKTYSDREILDFVFKQARVNGDWLSGPGGSYSMPPYRRGVLAAIRASEKSK